MGVNKKVFFYRRWQCKHKLLMVCMYLFIIFSICLFIFMKNTVREETGAEHWGAPTWIFLFTARHFICASFFPSAAFWHTHDERGFLLLRQQEWDDSDFNLNRPVLFLNGSCLVDCRRKPSCT